MDEVVDALQDVRGEVNDVKSALEEVEAAVNSNCEELKHAVESVEEAVKNKWSSVTVVWVIVIGTFLVSLPAKAWHSKWRYELEYSVDSDKVYKQPQPHDCNFLAAPMGEKYCHYDLKVSTLRWARSTAGMPISSMDDGKTWDVFTPEAGAVVPVSSTVQDVYVTWDKKEDE
jgi:hypothetical protein